MRLQVGLHQIAVITAVKMANSLPDCRSSTRFYDFSLISDGNPEFTKSDGFVCTASWFSSNDSDISDQEDGEQSSRMLSVSSDLCGCCLYWEIYILTNNANGGFIQICFWNLYKCIEFLVRITEVQLFVQSHDK
eukprot:c22572_g1_i1 orf=347-748(-)